MIFLKNILCRSEKKMQNKLAINGGEIGFLLSRFFESPVHEDAEQLSIYFKVENTTFPLSIKKKKAQELEQALHEKYLNKYLVLVDLRSPTYEVAVQVLDEATLRNGEKTSRFKSVKTSEFRLEISRMSIEYLLWLIKVNSPIAVELRKNMIQNIMSELRCYNDNAIVPIDLLKFIDKYLPPLKTLKIRFSEQAIHHSKNDLAYIIYV